MADEHCKKKRVTRYLTAKDVGRLVCAAKENGVGEAEIQREIAKCIQDPECNCQEIRNVIKNTLYAMAAVALVVAGLMVLPAYVSIIMIALARAGLAYRKARQLESAVKQLPKIEKVIEGQYEVLETSLKVHWKDMDKVVIRP